MEKAYARVPPEKWLFVSVAVAPSTITITEHGVCTQQCQMFITVHPNDKDLMVCLSMVMFAHVFPFPNWVCRCKARSNVVHNEY